MTDEEIYKQIEEYKNEANALYERTHEQVEASIVAHAQAKKKRKKLFVSLMSVAAVLIVTLAVVLPIVLQPQEQEIRYSDENKLLPDFLDCNLKEYYSNNNLSLLYLDLYEYAEDITTKRFYEEGKENITVYLSETFTDGNTGYRYQITVMKRNFVVESFEARTEEYQSTKIGDIEISYVLVKNSAAAKFEYNGYKYYLKINDGVTLDFLTATIESMLNH